MIKSYLYSISMGITWTILGISMCYDGCVWIGGFTKNERKTHGINTTISDPQKVLRPSGEGIPITLWLVNASVTSSSKARALDHVLGVFGRFRQSMLSVLLVEDDHNCQQHGILFVKRNSQGACFWVCRLSMIIRLLGCFCETFSKTCIIFGMNLLLHRISMKCIEMRHCLSSHTCGKPDEAWMCVIR